MRERVCQVCECVCGYLVKNPRRCPFCVDRGISSGSSRSCRAMQTSADHRTHTHTHTENDPTQTNSPSAAAEETEENPRHKHTQAVSLLISQTKTTAHKIPHTVNKQGLFWCTHTHTYTHIHTPSARVLSSECPFKLVMLEICPFFCRGCGRDGGTM